MKKGQEEVTDVFGYILIALVLTLILIAFVIFGKGKVEQQITALESNEVNINLLNYLRTNDTKTGYSIAELITYSYHNNNFDDIKRATQEFFDKFHDKDKCRIILVNVFKLNSDKIFGLASLGEDEEGIYKTSSLILPTYNPEEKLSVYYTERCKNE